MKYLEKSLKRQGYEAPQAEVIAMETQGVLCASGETPAPTSTNAGGGTTNMGYNSGYGW